MLKLLTLLLLLLSRHEENNEVADTMKIIKLSAAVKQPQTEKKNHTKKFEVTAYSNHYQSTGKRPGDNGYGITRSGAKTVEGVTIAADWRVLPKGTVVWIEGVGKRVVQDTGGAIKGNKIDVYFESEARAMDFGRRQQVKVKIVNKD